MKLRATATIMWDFDTDLPYAQAMEIAKHHLDEIPIHDNMKDVRLLIQLDKLRNKVEKVRIGEFQFDEVFPYFSNENNKKEYIVNDISYIVKMNSDRYFLFKNQSSCVSCGLKGTRIFLECLPNDEAPHFNLYGEEEEKLVLFTKDHIKAKCFGGKNELSNYQTMCSICNSLKAYSNLTVDAVKSLRNLYNKNKNKLTKKKLHVLLEQERTKLQQPWLLELQAEDFPPNKDSMRVKRSFKVVEFNGELFSETNTSYDANVVGIVNEGAYLEPMVEINKEVYCKAWKDKIIRVSLSLLR